MRTKIPRENMKMMPTFDRLETSSLTSSGKGKMRMQISCDMLKAAVVNAKALISRHR
jgi:hypothetical protein